MNDEPVDAIDWSKFPIEASVAPDVWRLNGLVGLVIEAVGGLQIIDDVPLTVDDILGRGGRT